MSVFQNTLYSVSRASLQKFRRIKIIRSILFFLAVSSATGFFAFAFFSPFESKESKYVVLVISISIFLLASCCYRVVHHPSLVKLMARTTVPSSHEPVSVRNLRLVSGDFRDRFYVFLLQDPESGERFIKKQLFPQQALAEDILSRGPYICPETHEMDNVMKRFEREIYCQALCSHPLISPVLVTGTEEIVIQIPDAQSILLGDMNRTTHTTVGAPFFLMPFIEGKILSEEAAFLKGNFPVIAQLIARLAGVLQHIHDRCIIHRDVKPQNIVVDPEGAPHLTDFELALPWRKVHYFPLAGTPRYIAPEIDVVDNLSDIYSLGVVAYELVEGRPPFEGDANVVLQAKRERNAPPLKIGVPQALSSAIYRAIERNPALRFQSATDMEKAFSVYVTSVA